MKNLPRLLTLAAALLLLAGCASLSAIKDPRRPLEARRHFFVESELADGHDVHKLIAEELRAMGYQASSGPLTMLPPEADTIIAYQTRWTWDFKTYLIMLNIQVRDAENDRPLAAIDFHRPGIGGMETRAMVRKVVSALVKPKPASAAPSPAPAKTAAGS